MMEKRLTLAFWAVLLGVAAWQSPNWWASATDPRIDGGPVPSVAEAPAPKAEPEKRALGPRRAEGYKVRDPRIPYKLDLRNKKQNAEFFPPTAETTGDLSFARNAPGNAGPFDSEGNLIVPLDPANLH